MRLISNDESFPICVLLRAKVDKLHIGNILLNSGIFKVTFSQTYIA